MQDKSMAENFCNFSSRKLSTVIGNDPSLDRACDAY